jgi:antitoxin CcdA
MNILTRPRRAAAKKAVNLRIDSELVELAKQTGLNLSQTLETTLRAALKAERERRWREENAAAVEAFDRYVDKNGVFGAEFKEW